MVVGNSPVPLIIMNTHQPALWLCFRCVKGEGEIEKLQAKVVELRRKLDDTTAAMQELGRENQSLQVSVKTLRHSLSEISTSCRQDALKETPLLVLSDQAVTESHQEVGRRP